MKKTISKSQKKPRQLAAKNAKARAAPEAAGVAGVSPGCEKCVLLGLVANGHGADCPALIAKVLEYPGIGPNQVRSADPDVENDRREFLECVKDCINGDGLVSVAGHHPDPRLSIVTVTVAWKAGDYSRDRDDTCPPGRVDIGQLQKVFDNPPNVFWQAADNPLRTPGGYLGVLGVFRGMPLYLILQTGDVEPPA